MHSAVLITPTALKAQADAVGAAMGWGPVSYTIPLGDGETVTHFAARADVGESFIGWCRGTIPLPDPAAQPVIDALIADFSPDPEGGEKPERWGWAHLSAVILAQELEVTEPPLAETDGNSGA